MRIVYRTRPGAEPPILDAIAHAPPIEGQVVKLNLDGLDLSAFAPRVQEQIRSLGVTHWTTTAVERVIRAPERRSDVRGPVEIHDFYDVVIQPRLDIHTVADQDRQAALEDGTTGTSADDVAPTPKLLPR